MSKRDIAILVILVGLASGFIGLRIGASRADTRVEVAVRECEAETSAAVERIEARAADCEASSLQMELALGSMPEREGEPSAAPQNEVDAGAMQLGAPRQRPEVTDPQTRATATALIDQALARRVITPSDRDALTALMPRLSQADQELFVGRVMTALQSGQLTIADEP